MSVTVLVAEDELLIAMDVMDELGAAGFVTIGPFARTQQAIEYCRSHDVDCAVLDVRLADGESYPLADLLAERKAPVVFHSGHAARGALMERYPQMRVCPKPAQTGQLAATVAEVCGRGV
jgi:AmiR/NasT family two-component response regulator